ncbi:MAG: hypothetical protein RTU30_11685 [Candidatus Thorarchaeota archaeon]
MPEMNLKKTDRPTTDDATLMPRRLREIAVEMLQRYGARGHEMTPDEILFRAEHMNLVSHKQVSMHKLQRILMKSWQQSEGTFYVIADRCFGLQSWRKSNEKQVIWEIIQTQEESELEMIGLLKSVLRKRPHLSGRLVFQLLNELVEDGRLRRNGIGMLHQVRENHIPLETGSKC